MLAVTFTQLLHPLSGNGYQFWSGIGSDFAEVGIVLALVAFFRRHNCHVRRCWRIQWHEYEDGDGTHMLCRRHHPDGKGCDAPLPSGRKAT